jgi:spore coat protein CotH
MKKTILIVLFAFGIAPRMFSQTFYDINTINTIEISFTQSNWDYLLDSLVANGQEERLLGTATINGQFFDSVGVRYKALPG